MGSMIVESPLPSEGERGELLRHLAEIVASRGFETFVRAPIVEPSRDIDNGSLDGAKNLYTIARCPPPAGGGGGGGCEFCPACNSCCPVPEPCPICPKTTSP